ncbi:RNA-protein complex protein Nop10 [Halodesulfurarchaeum sp.]|uniref:RNA-protein complex protein Nop10 n=1 Tax=Halodesulfurarchaeum sp. TaxID=1980530 RepID=UPI001BC098F5|nr:RNA-protein complex protein Nop10 [Halodesulfurarchaeum sp.]
MKSDIRICRDWKTAHERPVYTLGSTCPKCDGPSANSAPAKFDPADPYGEYRRALKERRQP